MTTSKITTIDEYEDTFPEETKQILNAIRRYFREIVPGATESISYDMPTLSLGGKHFMYYAAWKNHIALYPIYGDGGPLKDELSQYKKDKDSLHLPLTEPFPHELIKKLIAQKYEEWNQKEH